MGQTFIINTARKTSDGILSAVGFTVVGWQNPVIERLFQQSIYYKSDLLHITFRFCTTASSTKIPLESINTFLLRYIIFLFNNYGSELLITKQYLFFLSFIRVIAYSPQSVPPFLPRSSCWSSIFANQSSAILLIRSSHPLRLHTIQPPIS